jgi:tRNA U34 5-carboxymethylaminomethyl modifying GTPase MnmE/TrmE
VRKSSGLATVDFNSTETAIVESEVPVIVSAKQSGIDKMTEILASTLGECYVSQTDPVLSAERCVETLKLSNVSVETFLKNLTKADMINLVDIYGLPNEAKEWFTQLYANIETRAGVDVGGESNPS